MPCSPSRSSSTGVFTGSGPSSKVSATLDEPVMVTEPSGPSPPVSACDGGGDGDGEVDGAGGGDGRFDGSAQMARVVAGEEQAVSVTAPAASTASTSRREVMARPLPTACQESP